MFTVGEKCLDDLTGFRGEFLAGERLMSGIQDDLQAGCMLVIDEWQVDLHPAFGLHIGLIQIVPKGGGEMLSIIEGCHM